MATINPGRLHDVTDAADHISVKSVLPGRRREHNIVAMA